MENHSLIQFVIIGLIIPVLFSTVLVNGTKTQAQYILDQVQLKYASNAKLKTVENENEIIDDLKITGQKQSLSQTFGLETQFEKNIELVSYYDFNDQKNNNAFIISDLYFDDCREFQRTILVSNQHQQSCINQQDFGDY